MKMAKDGWINYNSYEFTFDTVAQAETEAAESYDLIFVKNYL